MTRSSAMMRPSAITPSGAFDWWIRDRQSKHRGDQRQAGFASLKQPFIVAVLLLLCGLGGAPSKARGQNQLRDFVFADDEIRASIVEPLQTKPFVYPVDPKASIGVAVSVDVRRWQTPGNLWVDIEIASPMAMTADRKFEFRFDPCPPGSIPQIRSALIKFEISLPQGSQRVSQTIHLPCYCLPSGLAFELFENGMVPPGYSDTIANPTWDRRRPLPRLFKEQADFDLLTLGTPTERASLSWQALECYDVVRLAPDLATNFDDELVRGALIDYLLCGGTVMVDPETEIEQLADALKINPIVTRQDRNGLTGNQGIDQWKTRSVGAGKIIQGPKNIPAQNSTPLPSTPVLETAEALSQILPLRSSPILRQGVDPMLGDARFFQWVVPGVAQPPVYTFMGLLTAFVILVGPIAYRRTAKYGRSYLIFAIAPILALLTTVAMFTYGIIADGFGTQARVRQITFVDGESGHAGERIRAAYFAGIRPQAGLKFDANSFVLPYPDSRNLSWESLQQELKTRPGIIELDDDGQRFGSTFLPSRQQRGFVSTRPRRDLGRLRFNQDNGPTVTSEFDFDLRRVVICDHDGKSWTAEQLPGGETVKCEAPKKATEISQKLGGMYNDYWLTGETRQARGGRQNNPRETRDLIANLNQKVGTNFVVTDGIFEELLINTLKNNPRLPPGFFVAMADVGEDAVAVTGAQLKKSIRYVFGTLPK